jgi:hypothetical protein
MGAGMFQELDIWEDLDAQQIELIVGGKNEQWQSPPGGEQVIPPGLFKNGTETGFVPPGLTDDPLNVPLHGNKNGLATSDIGIVPSGWTV